MDRIVGITCGWREEEARHLLHDDFIRVVCGFGGIPFLIPTAEAEFAAKYYECVDSIIFSGGDDPAPIYYGEEPRSGIGEITPRRDSFEMALAELVLKGDKPVLAICRGLQIINIAAGGTLYQDLKEITMQEHRQRAPRWYASHSVKFMKGSRLSRLLERDLLRVNSFHHQGVHQLGGGLKVAAMSADGLIEAVESIETGKYLFGVQWHPECLWESDESARRIFKSFLEASEKRRKN